MSKVNTSFHDSGSCDHNYPQHRRGFSLVLVVIDIIERLGEESSLLILHVAPFEVCVHAALSNLGMTGRLCRAVNTTQYSLAACRR